MDTLSPLGMPPAGLPPARKPNIIFAVFMIVAGTLLFLANLGFFPVRDVWDYWPLVFVAIGVSSLARRLSAGRILIGLVFIAVGVIATLFTTGILHARLHDQSWTVALVLITVGVTGLARMIDGEPWHMGNIQFRKRARRRYQWNTDVDPFFSQAANTANTESMLNDHTTMGNIKRRVESQSFQGGRLSTTMGNIKLDLRRARMPEGQKTARLEVHTFMGNVSLRIPDSWSLRWDGDNVMGSFVDKTIPPNTGLDAPQLLLTGSCTMGNIEIEN